MIRIGVQTKSYFYWKGLRYTGLDHGQILQTILAGTGTRMRSGHTTKKYTSTVRISHYQYEPALKISNC
jgi:hypothetical protein